MNRSHHYPVLAPDTNISALQALGGAAIIVLTVYQGVKTKESEEHIRETKAHGASMSTTNWQPNNNK